MTIWIETMEPDRFFSFRWHPYAIEPGSMNSNGWNGQAENIRKFPAG